MNGEFESSVQAYLSDLADDWLSEQLVDNPEVKRACVRFLLERNEEIVVEKRRER